MRQDGCAWSAFAQLIAHAKQLRLSRDAYTHAYTLANMKKAPSRLRR